MNKDLASRADGSYGKFEIRRDNRMRIGRFADYSRAILEVILDEDEIPRFETPNAS